MKQLIVKIANVKFIACALLCLFCQQATADIGAGSGQVKVYAGNGGVGFSGPVAVTAWQAVDDGGNSIARAAYGIPTDSPSNWTGTMLSTGLNSLADNPPLINANVRGDVIVSWQFYNSITGNFDVAVAVLENNTTAWNIAVVSDDTAESAGFDDQKASIDENGNAFILWTSMDIATSVIQLRCAATNISSPSWTPVTIAP